MQYSLTPYAFHTACFLISLIMLSACHFPDINPLTSSKTQTRQSNPDYQFKTAHTLSGRSDGQGFDLVFVADGFTQNEMHLFYNAVQDYQSFSRDYESVFSLQTNAWNMHVIQIPSNESGVDEPKTGTLKDTAFNSSFECEWVDRIICVDQEKVLDVVSEHFPQYDAILVLANSTRSGGASLGNNIITSSMSSSLNNTIIHELGHVMANLGDEYTYGGSSLPSREPRAANLTLNNDKQSVKWKHWLNSGYGFGNIQLFEGGSYLDYGVWRPSRDSVMRNLGQPFHAVNLEAWTLALYDHSGTYYNASPTKVVFEQTESEQTFEIELALGSKIQNIEWRVNDQLVQPNFNQHQLTLHNQTQDYIVQANIYDNSGVIRKDYKKLSQDTLTWWVMVN